MYLKMCRGHTTSENSVTLKCHNYQIDYHMHNAFGSMRNWNIRDHRIYARRGRREPFLLGSGQSNTTAQFATSTSSGSGQSDTGVPNSRPALCWNLDNPTRRSRIRDRHFVGIWAIRHKRFEFATSTLSRSGQSDTRAPNS